MHSSVMAKTGSKRARQVNLCRVLRYRCIVSSDANLIEQMYSRPGRYTNQIKTVFSMLNRRYRS